MNTIKWIFFFVFCFPLLVHSQHVKQSVTPSKKAMILGVYHFNNPDMDTYNIEVDDYFTEERQEEIKEVVDALAKFKPNKILVEFMPSQQSEMDSLLMLYLEGHLGLKEIEGGQNEAYQLGFRLAKKLGIKEVIAIDHPGVYLAPYADFIADTLAFTAYQEYDKAYKAKMEARQQAFLKNTVKENLIFLNDWQQILDNHQYYNSIAIPVRDTLNVMFRYQEKEVELDGLPYQMRSFDFNNIGVELVAEWHKRNLFIYRNIVQHTAEDDRILILIGSGHLRYLQQFLGDNPAFDVVGANSFLKNEN